MDIAVRVRNIEVPDPVRVRTLERVTRLGPVLAVERAEVCFSEVRHRRTAERAVCEITLHGRGPALRAHAAAADPAVAADRVLEKLRHRLERLRGRRRSVHFAAHLQGGPRDPDMASDPGGPARGTRTEAMTPEEAALEMALLSYDLYFFINTETAAGAVVYRRADGDVGLVAGM